MVNQQFFFFFLFVVVVVVVFTVKLDATNSFPSNTAEIRPTYLKMGDTMRKPVFVICEQQKHRSVAHPHSLISTFVVRCLDSKKILQLKAIHIIQVRLIRQKLNNAAIALY